jgi:two-component system, cell cycle response regulator DivK
LDEVWVLQTWEFMPRIIVVDDHGDTRLGYAEFLSAFGFEVRTAADADELRMVLEEWLPHAIVLDLQLPRTDGWQLTREIKGDPRTRAIQIVVVSACVLPSERSAAEEAGCDAFISKPVDPMVIVEQLRQRTRPAGTGAD